MPPVDILGNVLAIPGKVFLFDWRFTDHSIPAKAEAVLVQYLNDRSQDISHTKIRLNQYAPLKDLKRLFTNHEVAWPYRVFPGLISTLLVDVLLPGRIFPWGDYYNPWTDTIHLYSSHPAIGLHELGHAHDFSQQPYKGTYGLARTFPLFTLHQEWRATDEAINYLIETGDRRHELGAYKILYPAFGSYVGGLVPLPFAQMPGVFLGHIIGRTKAASRKRFYRGLDADMKRRQSNAVTSSP